MRTAVAVTLAVSLSACATLTSAGIGPEAVHRDRLWRQGHAALAADSFVTAASAFQRLAANAPRTLEGREARFHLGAIYLNPRNPAFDPAVAEQHLGLFIAQDTVAGRILRRPEARALMRLARELQLPCAERAESLRCETVAITEPGPQRTVVVAEGSGAEVARLRRDLAEREATIRQLREELQRIRNTLAPRP